MQRLAKSEVIARIKRDGAIAIIRTSSSKAAIATANAAIEGGFRIVEITFGVPDATKVIADLVRQHPDGIIFGAGTVLTRANVDDAVDAGAQFLVSPCVLREMIDAARAREVTSIPGAFTPTEIYSAHQMGADIIKLFPAVQSGPAYLRAIRGPLPQIPILPTAGVNAGNVAEWFQAGAIAVGAAGGVLDKDAIERGDWKRIAEISREFLAAVKSARS